MECQEIATGWQRGGTDPWVGASKEKLLLAMEGHILAQGELMGTYKEK
jgi:phosphatidylethanolamine-binding protein (PEBP) family uncharacterized protein